MLVVRVQNNTTQQRGSATQNKITHITLDATKHCSRTSPYDSPPECKWVLDLQPDPWMLWVLGLTHSHRKTSGKANLKTNPLSKNQCQGNADTILNIIEDTQMKGITAYWCQKPWHQRVTNGRLEGKFRWWLITCCLSEDPASAELLVFGSVVSQRRSEAYSSLSYISLLYHKSHGHACGGDMCRGPNWYPIFAFHSLIEPGPQG